MCGNPATVLICEEVAIPINPVLGRFVALFERFSS